MLKKQFAADWTKKEGESTSQVRNYVTQSRRKNSGGIVKKSEKILRDKGGGKHKKENRKRIQGKGEKIKLFVEDDRDKRKNEKKKTKENDEDKVKGK